MPQMEYLVLADYVRQDAAATHIMGAGIDTFTVPEGRLPASAPVGVVARMSFDVRDQVGAEHEVSLVFHGPGATELLRLTQRLRTPPPAPGVPEHWRTAANLIFDLDSDGDVIGIEVVSIRHPWALGDILRDYRIPSDEAAQLRAYFQPDDIGPVLVMLAQHGTELTLAGPGGELTADLQR